MKLNISVKLNLKIPEATGKVAKAARLAMRDTVVEITSGAVKDSPWKTGNNMRSLTMESSGFATGEGVVDQNKIEGAVYSTSGYGGFLETGTGEMDARPYIKPNADKQVPKFPTRMRGYIG